MCTRVYTCTRTHMHMNPPHWHPRKPTGMSMPRPQSSAATGRSPLQRPRAPWPAWLTAGRFQKAHGSLSLDCRVSHSDKKGKRRVQDDGDVTTQRHTKLGSLSVTQVLAGKDCDPLHRGNQGPVWSRMLTHRRAQVRGRECYCVK